MTSFFLLSSLFTSGICYTTPVISFVLLKTSLSVSLLHEYLQCKFKTSNLLLKYSSSPASIILVILLSPDESSALQVMRFRYFVSPPSTRVKNCCALWSVLFWRSAQDSQLVYQCWEKLRVHVITLCIWLKRKKEANLFLEIYFYRYSFSFNQQSYSTLYCKKDSYKVISNSARLW